MTNDQQLIERGVARARAENREIDDGTARVIASQFHDGSAAALAFTSTGTITDVTNLWAALASQSETDYSTRPAWEREALDYLGTYLLNREDRGPVPGWQDLWGPDSVVKSPKGPSL